MGTNREIVFSARDNGVESTMTRIKNSAKEMGRDLVNEAMQNTSTAKDAIKYYEEQIKLIEKRNREGAKASKISAENQRNRGLNSAGGGAEAKNIQSQYSKSIREINTGSKEDQMQVDLLRDLIDAVKSTSREEVRTDKGIANDERVHESRLSGSEFSQLGSRLKSESQGGSSGSQQAGSGGRGAGNVMGGVSDVLDSNSASGSIGSAAGMLSGKAGMIGAAAYGAYKIGTSTYLQGRDREMELKRLASTSGISVNALMHEGIGSSTGGYGPAAMNVSRAEFNERVAPDAAIAYGSMRNVLSGTNGSGKAIRGLEVEKGMGVDSGVVSSLAKLTRVVVGSGDAQDQANSLYRRMDGSGAFGKSGGDMSRMSEIMQSFVELQSANFMRSGSMSGSGMTMDLMGRFESLGGAYKSDQYKASTIQSLDSGLSSGGSSETNAIKMGILRQLNPEKGYFDLQVEMEKGTNSKGYLESVMKYVRNTGGDGNSQKILLDQLTGGQMRGADISRMVNSREFDSAGLGNAFVAGGDSDFNFKGKAVSNSSGQDAKSIIMEESAADIKDTLLLGLSAGFESLGEKLDELIKIF